MSKYISHIRISSYLIAAILVINVIYLFDFKDFSLSSFFNYLTASTAFLSLFIAYKTYEKSKKEFEEKAKKDLLQIQPSFLFNKVREFTTTETLRFGSDIEYKKYYYFTFSMKNIGKIARYLSFSEAQNYKLFESISLPEEIPVLSNEDTQEIQFVFQPFGEFLCSELIVLNFKINYRDSLGEQRTLPLIMSIKPTQNLKDYDRSYKVILTDDPKNIK